MGNLNQRGWEQYIEKLKEKWLDFAEGLFTVIREEEMRIRREEVEKSQPCI
jgi:hypothetical protein